MCGVTLPCVTCYLVIHPAVWNFTTPGLYAPCGCPFCTYAHLQAWPPAPVVGIKVQDRLLGPRALTQTRIMLVPESRDVKGTSSPSSSRRQIRIYEQLFSATYVADGALVG